MEDRNLVEIQTKANETSNYWFHAHEEQLKRLKEAKARIAELEAKVAHWKNVAGIGSEVNEAHCKALARRDALLRRALDNLMYDTDSDRCILFNDIFKELALKTG